MFDEHGAFIEGYYIVGLLAEAFLKKQAEGIIVHGPRLTWNTESIVKRYQGTCVQSKTGHAFIKETMRKADAVYGGEMSAHHYFKSFAYCDSGMIPWLLIAELMTSQNTTLSALVDSCRQSFPCSGEINQTLANPPTVLAAIEAHYVNEAVTIDHTDGLSINFDDWRFNVRSSNTEPVVRLNVESRGDKTLMQEKTQEVLALMASFSD